MLPFLKIAFKNLLKGPSTDPFPFAEAYTPPRFRGRAELDHSKCILCGICRNVCAGGAIQFRATEDGTGMEFWLWHNSCVFCGMCAHYCPTKALTMTNDWHMAHLAEDRYTMCEHKFVAFGACASCGARIQPRPQGIVDKIGSKHPDKFMLCPKCKRESMATHAIASRKVIPVGETK